MNQAVTVVFNGEFYIVIDHGRRASLEMGYHYAEGVDTTMSDPAFSVGPVVTNFDMTVRAGADGQMTRLNDLTELFDTLAGIILAMDPDRLNA